MKTHTALSGILLGCLCAAAICCFAFGLTVPAEASAPKVTISGAPLDLPEESPYISETGHIMVPLRSVANALGIRLSWSQISRSAALHGTTADGARVTMNVRPGSVDVRVTVLGADPVSGRHHLTRDTAPTTDPITSVGGRMYISARTLADAFGWNVQWDVATQTLDFNR